MASFTSIKHKYYSEYFNRFPVDIDALIFDFDGVFTDNKVILSETGEESVVCSRGDGLLLEIFRDLYSDIPLMVISKETNIVVTKRCAKLKLTCLHGIDDKLSVLTQWCKDNGKSLDNIIYLGNDLNDLDCMRAVHCGVAVNDSYTEILDIANIILKSTGGNGAVRELLEAVHLYLSQK